MDIDIFGYLRFFYLGHSDWRLIKNVTDIEQRKKILYAPQRLEERFYLFEKICLPSLRWQTDPGFRLLIVSSPELPEHYQKRLAASVADIPQVEVVYDSSLHLNTAINTWMARQKIVHKKRTAHFRLDDDDALSSDFIATLRQHKNNVPDHGIISRPYGVLLADTPEGPEILCKFECYIAIGFTLVNPAGHIFNPYQLGHRQYHRQVPSLMLPNQLAYIHTAHLHADTLADNGDKLKDAQAYHSRLSESRHWWWFRDAFHEQFGGLWPRDFTEIIRNSPQKNTAEAGINPLKS